MEYVALCISEKTATLTFSLQIRAQGSLPVECMMCVRWLEFQIIELRSSGWWQGPLSSESSHLPLYVSKTSQHLYLNISVPSATSLYLVFDLSKVKSELPGSVFNLV